MSWYLIDNIQNLETPFLALYKDRIQQNIKNAIKLIGDVSLLRPHAKTHKMTEVSRMLMDAGISKFKCATIAEAEMLAMAGAIDVLIAYQPVGPATKRLALLTQLYPATSFSCVLDHHDAAVQLSQVFEAADAVFPVFIDLNTGMNRTGIIPSKAIALFEHIQQLKGLEFRGIHFYDGHVLDTDVEQRQYKSDEGFQHALNIISAIESSLKRPVIVVGGGSPSFPTHAKRHIECSPGTFVFWDWGYKQHFPDEPFELAALVVTRVISIVNNELITTDLGYKAVASENPLPRVHFLNAPDARPVSQSEEHLVVKVADSSKYAIGDTLYGVPVHICPTVALYAKAAVIENGKFSAAWKVIARDRNINI